MTMYWLSIEDVEKLSLSELLSLLEEERKKIHNRDGFPAFVHPGMLEEAKKVNLGFLHRLIRRKQIHTKMISGTRSEIAAIYHESSATRAD